MHLKICWNALCTSQVHFMIENIVSDEGPLNFRAKVHFKFILRQNLISNLRLVCVEVRIVLETKCFWESMLLSSIEKFYFSGRVHFRPPLLSAVCSLPLMLTLQSFLAIDCRRERSRRSSRAARRRGSAGRGKGERGKATGGGANQPVA